MNDYLMTGTLPVAQVPPTVHMLVMPNLPDRIACGSICNVKSHLLGEEEKVCMY